MTTTIFGAVWLLLIFLFIYECLLNLFGLDQLTLGEYVPGNVYDASMTTILTLSIFYGLCTLWSRLVFGEGIGLIFK